jgi:hypothetical protein
MIPTFAAELNGDLARSRGLPGGAVFNMCHRDRFL